MQVSRILTIASDKSFLTLVRQQLRDHLGVELGLIVAGSIGEACSLLETVCPRLIVVHWTRERARYEQLDRLLWTASVLTRRTPVLVIAERYRTDQATMMYRMGVSEYISCTHHLEQLGRVLRAYVPGAAPIAFEACSADVAAVPADQPRGKRHGRRPIAAQVG
jgi:DNA-binding NtrC family response regulator